MIGRGDLRRLLLFLLSLIFLFSCATGEKVITKVRQDIYQRRYESALKALDESELAHSKKDELLYYLERGTLLFLLRRYDESITYFQKAKDKIDELYAISVHKQAESFLSNDLALPYKGEDFERVLIHYYLALNYLMKGNLEDALVESRQVILYLDEINDRYKKKNVYHDDAFVRYLNGILFEIGREFNDSYVDYYNSYKAFKYIYKKYYKVGIPRILYRDLKRLSAFLGIENDYRKWNKKYPAPVLPENVFLNEKCEIILIMEAGFIPRKRQGTLDVALRGQWVRIAFPKYDRDVPSRVRGARLEAGKFSARSVLMEPLARIAFYDLQDRGARIMARAAARIAVKHGLAAGVEDLARKSKNPYVRLGAGLVGLAGHILASASEQADIRGWYTLPHDVYITRLLLDPGNYPLRLKIMGRDGKILEVVDLGQVNLKPGDRVFKYYRVPY